MQDKSITIPLSQRQAFNLQQARETFSFCELSEHLGYIFTYALEGMNTDAHAVEVAKDHDKFAKIKWLLEIILKPDVQFENPFGKH